MSDNILPFNPKFPTQKLKAEDAIQLKCSSCGCVTFSNVFMLKRFKENETIIADPIFACSKCGLALEETLPKKV